MSTRIRVAAFPRSRPMVATMSGTYADIPVVTISEEDHDDAEVCIQLGNTEDPATWLRKSAAALLTLADACVAAEVTA